MREKGFILTHSVSLQFLVSGKSQQQEGDVAHHVAKKVEKQRVTSMCVHPGSQYRDWCHLSQAHLPMSVNLIKTVTCRHIQKPATQETLELIELMMEISHCKGLNTKYTL